MKIFLIFLPLSHADFWPVGGAGQALFTRRCEWLQNGILCLKNTYIFVSDLLMAPFILVSRRETDTGPEREEKMLREAHYRLDMPWSGLVKGNSVWSEMKFRKSAWSQLSVINSTSASREAVGSPHRMWNSILWENNLALRNIIISTKIMQMGTLLLREEKIKQNSQPRFHIAKLGWGLSPIPGWSGSLDILPYFRV